MTSTQAHEVREDLASCTDELSTIRGLILRHETPGNLACAAANLACVEQVIASLRGQINAHVKDAQAKKKGAKGK